MKIKPELLWTSWYEDKDGNRMQKVDYSGDMPPDPPENALSLHFMFPTQLTESVYNAQNTKGKPVAEGSQSWSEDLVLAMVNSDKNDWSLSDCIIITASNCERCMNALAHEYGLSWGYAELSDEWQECGTVCKFCTDIAVYRCKKCGNFPKIVTTLGSNGKPKCYVVECHECKFGSDIRYTVEEAIAHWNKGNE